MNNLNAHLFTHCPRCGETSLTTASQKSFACGVCHFKFYLNTAAAGIALIFNSLGELLVTVRSHDPARGMLDFPGGFAEPGESMEACITREVKEELNLDISTLQYFCSVPSTYLYKEVTYSITDFAFFCTVKDFSGILARDDVSDYFFIKPADLDKHRLGLDSPKIIVDRLLRQA